MRDECTNDYVPSTERAYYHRARAVLKRFNRDERCTGCGCCFDLQVHHIDENIKNNHPDNLMYVCYLCHADIHPGRLNFRRELDENLQPTHPF